MIIKYRACSFNNIVYELYGYYSEDFSTFYDHDKSTGDFIRSFKAEEIANSPAESLAILKYAHIKAIKELDKKITLLDKSFLSNENFYNKELLEYQEVSEFLSKNDISLNKDNYSYSLLERIKILLDIKKTKYKN